MLNSFLKVRYYLTFLTQAFFLCFRHKSFSQKLSMVILNWKRTQCLETIVEKYATYGFIEDIIVWNNNREVRINFDHLPNVKVVNCSFDHGLDSRFAACLLCNRDHILIQDDDLIMPKISLLFLFQRYLKQSSIIHGILGRSSFNGYERAEVYGSVDIVLTRAMILNCKYIKPYFKAVSAFDDIRKYTCGNGEDIIMNYVVKNLTGMKNKAYAVLYKDYDLQSKVSQHAMWRRPLHFQVRREITRCAQFMLVRKEFSFLWDKNLYRELTERFSIAQWFLEFKNKGLSINLQNYTFTDNIQADQLLEALTLMKR